MKLKSTRDAFGEVLLDLARREKRLVVVSADLASSLRVKAFAKRYPKRFFEVGVAEQNAAGVAAGLALAGKIPFLVSFACFSPGLNWGQIRQSICLNRANVKIIGSHGGLATGADGATHQALEDLALMRVLPGMKVFVPLDYYQTRRIVKALLKEEGPAYLRLVRPQTVVWKDHSFVVGKAEILQRGNRWTLVGCGPLLAETIFHFQKKLAGVEIINCPTLKPFDKAKIVTSATKTGRVVTLEDHQRFGGLGSLVAEVLAEEGVGAKLTRIGMKDCFGESARDFRQLWQKYFWRRLEKIISEDKSPGRK